MRVLEDINTLVTYTDEKSADFAMNQVVRVVDQIATDTAAIFSSQFLGKVQNNEAGRVSLWNALLRHRQSLEQMNAIEDYDPDALVVEPAVDKKKVIARERVNIAQAMTQLYIETTVA